MGGEHRGSRSLDSSSHLQRPLRSAAGSTGSAELVLEVGDLATEETPGETLPFRSQIFRLHTSWHPELFTYTGLQPLEVFAPGIEDSTFCLCGQKKSPSTRERVVWVCHGPLGPARPLLPALWADPGQVTCALGEPSEQPASQREPPPVSVISEQAPRHLHEHVQWRSLRGPTLPPSEWGSAPDPLGSPSGLFKCWGVQPQPHHGDGPKHLQASPDVPGLRSQGLAEDPCSKWRGRGSDFRPPDGCCEELSSYLRLS